MQLEKLLSTPIELESRGKKGQEIILKNQGVLKKYVDAIQHILNKTTEKSLNIQNYTMNEQKYCLGKKLFTIFNTKRYKE